VPVLFTDLTNRTTNDIYQRLGYRPVEDRLEIEFQSVETIADNANGQPFAPSSVVAALVKVPVPRAHRAPVWTVEEARAFLESARTANDPFYAAYVLMLVLGLRRGEIFGLAWSEVDLEAREALIAWHLQRVAGRVLGRETRRRHPMRPCLFPKSAFALWRVGSNSRGDSGPRLRHGTSRAW
jgi:integrase